MFLSSPRAPSVTSGPWQIAIRPELSMSAWQGSHLNSFGNFEGGESTHHLQSIIEYSVLHNKPWVVETCHQEEGRNLCWPKDGLESPGGPSEDFRCAYLLEEKCVMQSPFFKV